MITLTCLKSFQFPIQAPCINPDVFLGKKVEEIAAFEVWEGNKQKKLGDLFKIEESPDEPAKIVINGDVSRVRNIGLGMKNGEIIINGNAGMHTGEKMKGGKIVINGNAGGWTGGGMKGGLIEIHGDASDYLASPYRGSTDGMCGGKIVVDGKVGSDSACYMQGGVIKIKGDSGPFLGYHMSDGSIHVEKNAKPRFGANMTGGKIVVSGVVDEMMPTFSIDSVKPKVKIDETETVSGPFYVFLGDLAANGKGKLFVSKVNNSKLSATYDKYL